MIAGREVEITVPIKFEKSQQIDKQYLSKETTIKLNGKYKNAENKEQELTGESKIKINWTEEPQIEIDQEIEKYINIEETTLIQQKITSQIINNTILQTKTIETKIPKIQETLPNEVKILVNGERISQEKYTYNEQTQTIKIQNDNIEENNDEYKIIYKYPIKYEEEIQMQLETKIQANLYTEETTEVKNEKQVNAQKTTNNVLIKNQTTEKIYKGNMYAGEENITNYQENISIEMSSLDQINEIRIEKMEDNFINNQSRKQSVNNSTYINNIKLNKENIENILGQDFEIKVLGENNQELYKITKESQWGEDGNISIDLNEIRLETIQIIFSKPINIGTLNIEINKYIKGNAGYNKQTLKTLTELENSKLVVIAEEGVKISNKNKLEDTQTQANIKINNKDLTTMYKNENVQIDAILKSDNEKYDLYKNPYIEIELPKELQKIDIKSIKILYGEEFELEKAVYEKENKIIQIQFKGEQTRYKTQIEEGTHIVINADLTFEKDNPTKETQLKMTYKNENANQEKYETATNINLKSKYGAILYNEVQEFNKENTIIETTENEQIYGNLDIQEKGKQATAYQTFINNYDFPINEITITGNLKQTNVNAKIHDIKANKENIKIYYSNKENITQTSKQWKESTENLEEIKSYKIELTEEIQPKESLEIAYKLDIPANLELNSQIKQDTDVTYYYNEQKLNTKSSFILATQEKSLGIATNDLKQIQGTKQVQQGIKTEIVAISANKKIEDGEEIFEGQPIKYEVKVTNNTGKNLNNFKFTAEHTNVIYYNKIETEQKPEFDAGSGIVAITQQDENLQKIERTLETLKNGEVTTFTYEFVPKKKDGTEIKGNIKISANDMEEQQIETNTNKIKDAQMAIEVINNTSENIMLNEDNEITLQFNINNYTDTEQKDVILNIQTSDLLSYTDEKGEESYEQVGLEFLKYENNQLKLKIPNMAAKENKKFFLTYMINKLSDDKEFSDIPIYYTAKLGDTMYYSNTLIRQVQRLSARISAVQKSDIKDNKVKVGDKVTFSAEITNTDKVLNANDVEIKHKVSNGQTKIEKAYLKRENGETIEVNLDKTDEAQAEISLKPGEKVQYIAESLIWNNPDEEAIYEETIKSNMTIYWHFGRMLKVNEVVADIQEEDDEKDPDEGDPDEGDSDEKDPDENNPDKNDPDKNNPDEKDPNGNQTDSSNSGNQQGKNYSISGQVWLDENKNSVKENNEKKISNIEVQLLDATNSKIALNNDSKKCITKTQSDGTYTFSKIPQGEYIVLFKYDNNMYSVTQYQKEGIDESQNSDVIQKTIQGEEVATTDILTISNANLKNIDAGFIQNKEFDLSLNKTISKITIKNDEGTRIIEGKDSKLAKAEINAKYINNTTVSVQYNIEVKNEGEITGYVNEIIDYMPNDLSFDSNTNKDWYIDKEGNLHNVSLSNTGIKPGESKKVTLTLTKQMTANNTGISVNVAEIEKATNELSIEDVDSTPGNRKDGEDDISTAELLTSIKTGTGIKIAISIITIITLLGTTIVIIKIKKGGK